MLSLTLPYTFSEENVFIIFAHVIHMVHVPFTSLSLVEVSPYFVTSTIYEGPHNMAFVTRQDKYITSILTYNTIPGSKSTSCKIRLHSECI